VLIERAELREVGLTLLRPFETSFGLQREKRCLLLRLDCEGVVGWGECVAGEGPWYSEETVGTAWHILSEFMLPQVVGRRVGSAEELLAPLRRVRGNNMARATVEAAYQEARARAGGVSLARLLGGERPEIESGVSIGIQASPSALVATVHRELAAGYRRIKIKVKPGADVEYARAVRELFPDVKLMVDANSAYRLEDAQHLRALDECDLLMIEQPLAHDDIVDHAALAKRLRTPICLDESIHSASDARKALELGSCRIINIKSGRLGGLSEAVRTHDVCAEHGAPVWCGGMLETNVGRAQNVALASLPGFTLPGDVSASERYFERDIAFPNIELNERGMIPVPQGPGSGVEVDERRLQETTVRREEFRP
jgi:O-succinylbenzoate synthase